MNGVIDKLLSLVGWVLPTTQVSDTAISSIFTLTYLLPEATTLPIGKDSHKISLGLVQLLFGDFDTFEICAT